MRILAVESSANIASAAILENGRVLASAAADETKKHAETLMPLIETLLTDCHLAIRDIDAFAVDIGPGSFTGVRIGVCAVNAMAFALEKPVIPVSSLTVLAEPFRDGDARVLTMLDAGHGAAYAAAFQDGLCVEEPAARDIETLLSEQAEGTRIVQERIPDAIHVALAAWRERDHLEKAAVPLYVQPSQAERLFAKRMGESTGE